MLLFSLLLTSCLKQDKINLKPNSQGGSSSSKDALTRWSSHSPQLNLYYSDEFDGEFAGSDFDSDNHHPLEQSAKEWNNKTGENFFTLPMIATTNKTYNDLEDFYDDEMGIYQAHSWYPEINSTALAITQYFGRRKNKGTSYEYIEMVHADIIMNYDNYSFSTDKNDSSTYDLHSVIIHELGHFMGLRHFDDFSTPSVMHPYMSIFDAKREVQDQDVENVHSLYEQASGQSPLKIHTAVSAPGEKTDDELVRGIIELRADGRCHHSLNGKFQYSH